MKDKIMLALLVLSVIADIATLVGFIMTMVAAA